jgi:hypothetical protein
MRAVDSVFTFMVRLINDPALKQEIGLMACQKNPFSSAQMQQQHGEYKVAIK